MISFVDDTELKGYEQLTIQQGNDYEGNVQCTLVRLKSNRRRKTAVLHVHGFNDYFFHDHMGRVFFDNNIDFYAVDLRKSGRSILPHQKMNNLRSISEYFEDIKSSLQLIRQLHEGQVILFGHSMGGLVAALFAADPKNAALFDGLFLNSPFFEQNKDVLTRKLLIPLVANLGKSFPNMRVPGGFSKFYGPSLHQSEHGMWNYNLLWKPHVADLVNAGWVRAIYLAQKEIQAGKRFTKPVLIAFPQKSYANFRWNDRFMTADAVVNVKHIRKYAKKMTGDVRIFEIPDAVHDLFLSSQEPRNQAIELVFNWIGEKFPLSDNKQEF